MRVSEESFHGDNLEVEENASTDDGDEFGNRIRYGTWGFILIVIIAISVRAESQT